MTTALDYDAGDHDFTLTVKALDKNDSTLSRFHLLTYKYFLLFTNFHPRLFVIWLI